jgi:hypothetical protein
LYYKSEVLKLWIYIAELIYRHDKKELLSSSTLANSPHLAHLILRHVECSCAIRDLAPAELKANIDVEDLLRTLDALINASFIDPNIKVRATAIRILQQCHWRSGEVLNLNNEPASTEVKHQALRDIQEAINLNELSEESKRNEGLLYYALYRVRTGLGLPCERNWEDACAHLELVDSNDLYVTLPFLVDNLKRALTSDDSVVIQKSIAAIKEAMSLGEWGQMFYSGFWKKSEPVFQQWDTWKTEWTRAIGGSEAQVKEKDTDSDHIERVQSLPAAPVSHAPNKTSSHAPNHQANSHRHATVQTPAKVQPQSSAGNNTFAKQVGKAVAQEVVKDTILSLLLS